MLKWVFFVFLTIQILRSAFVRKMFPAQNILPFVVSIKASKLILFLLSKLTFKLYFDKRHPQTYNGFVILHYLKHFYVKQFCLIYKV